MIPVSSNRIATSSSMLRGLGEPSSGNNRNSSSSIEEQQRGSRGGSSSKKVEQLLSASASPSDLLLMDREQEERRLNKIALMILRIKQSHQLASKIFEQRQSYFVFIPLQLLALLTAAEGILLGTGAFLSDKDGVVGLILGLVGLLSLTINNMSKRWDFDGKGKSHEIVARHMRWLLDDIEMIINHYDEQESVSVSVSDHGSSKHGEKLGQIEAAFYTESRLCQNLLPRQIEIAYEKLTIQLEIMLRPPSFRGNSNGNSNGNGKGGDNSNIDLYLDDRSYYKIVKFAYSELAIVLGDSDKRWIIRLPQPDLAVQETIQRVSKVLLSPRGDTNNDDYRKLKRLFPNSAPPAVSFFGRANKQHSTTIPIGSSDRIDERNETKSEIEAVNESV